MSELRCGFSQPSNQHHHHHIHIHYHTRTTNKNDLSLIASPARVSAERVPLPWPLHVAMSRGHVRSARQEKGGLCHLPLLLFFMFRTHKHRLHVLPRGLRPDVDRCPGIPVCADILGLESTIDSLVLSNDHFLRDQLDPDTPRRGLPSLCLLPPQILNPVRLQQGQVFDQRRDPKGNGQAAGTHSLG